MRALLISLVAIAALDSLNPTATAIQVFLLSTPKPIVRSIAFVVGVFTAYWTVGLLIILGLREAIAALVNQVDLALPGSILYGLQFLLGVVLLVIGWKLNSFNKTKTERRPQKLTLIDTFVLGLAVTIWESPTALPYLAAIQQIIRANLDWLSIVAILGLYNLIFVFPLIVLLGIYIVLQGRSAALLHRINRAIEQWGPRILRVVLIVLGAALVLNGVAYTFGRPLF
jgi:cytochrome c biogenesis protein CcdA